MTVVSLSGADVHLDGRPTCAGRAVDAALGRLAYSGRRNILVELVNKGAATEVS